MNATHVQIGLAIVLIVMFLTAATAFLVDVLRGSCRRMESIAAKGGER